MFPEKVKLQHKHGEFSSLEGASQISIGKQTKYPLQFKVISRWFYTHILLLLLVYDVSILLTPTHFS